MQLACLINIWPHLASVHVKHMAKLNISGIFFKSVLMIEPHRYVTGFVVLHQVFAYKTSM